MGVKSRGKELLGTRMHSEDAVKLYRVVVKLELDIESMVSFNRTCLHRTRKCYLGAQMEASVIVADPPFYAMSPRLQRLGSGGPNVLGGPCVFFVSIGPR